MAQARRRRCRYARCPWTLRRPPSTTCSNARSTPTRRISTSCPERRRPSACTAISQPLVDAEPVMPERRGTLLYRILSTEQQKQLEVNRQLDFSYGVPGLARFRVNVHFQRDSLAAAFRHIPEELRTLEELGLPPSLARARDEASRPRPRHRADRLGQVDDARVDGRRGQPPEAAPHPHDRGPDRVRAPPQAVRRHAARDRHRCADASPKHCAPRCARTPT